MPLLLQKYRVPHRNILRDVRPVSQRVAEIIEAPYALFVTALTASLLFFMHVMPYVTPNIDILALIIALYFRWAFKRPFKLALKFPQYANLPDPNNPTPGKEGAGKSDGILYLGNYDDSQETTYRNELWITNNDARTHILYLGTTGSGKTEGLKGLVTNALTWGSGFVYVDGKADTDLWSSLYAVARRFGRDDDVFVLNYMTGNSDAGAVSNTMNPFSNGSSSYLANMLTSFMPEAGGDNAMWKERAIALMFALMPALVWKRDYQGLLLDIGVVRDHIELKPIIRLSRDPNMPERVTHGLQGYLNTLPGFTDAAFDDEGNERPPSPDQPMYDLQVARQQHGYLSMQFTRPLQMLADEYMYIFKAQLADIDVLDVVLNRRILVVLIPALEKSENEAANLGKIVAASLKGMMGMTLGNTVEGSWEMAIGSKQTRSASPFMTVFDEVGYYVQQGMAVMAAQARSLGFALVFSAQDLPAMEKRVKQEAKSILGNCNLKIYGRIEDPIDTMNFIDKHTQNDYVMETSSMKAPTNTVSSLFMTQPFYDEHSAKIDKRIKFDADMMKGQREGEVHYTFAELFGRARMFYVDAGKPKAIRVQHLLPVPGTTSSTAQRERALHELAARLKDEAWTAAEGNAAAASAEIGAIAKAVATAEAAQRNLMEAGAIAVASVAELPQAKPKAAAPPEKISAKPGEAPPRATVPVAGILAQEKPQSRAGLPPLGEGDQYVIAEVEESPYASASEAPTSARAVAVASNAASPGYMPTDADFEVVTHPGMSPEEENVLDVQLPADIAALLEQSAQRLNRGLTGTTRH